MDLGPGARPFGDRAGAREFGIIRMRLNQQHALRCRGGWVRIRFGEVSVVLLGHGASVL